VERGDLDLGQRSSDRLGTGKSRNVGSAIRRRRIEFNQRLQLTAAYAITQAAAAEARSLPRPLVALLGVVVGGA
jgi:hypothetical protein